MPSFWSSRSGSSARFSSLSAVARAYVALRDGDIHQDEARKHDAFDVVELQRPAPGPRWRAPLPARRRPPPGSPGRAARGRCPNGRPGCARSPNLLRAARAGSDTSALVQPACASSGERRGNTTLITQLLEEGQAFLRPGARRAPVAQRARQATGGMAPLWRARHRARQLPDAAGRRARGRSLRAARCASHSSAAALRPRAARCAHRHG